MAIIIEPLETDMTADGDKGKRKYKSVYRLIHDDETVSPYTAGRLVQKNTTGTSPGTDAGDEYEWHGWVDPWATASPIASARLEKPKYRDKNNGSDRIFLVTITHSMQNRDRCKDKKEDDPLLEPWTYAVESEEWSIKTSFDRFGQPVLTSSFEPVSVDRFVTRRRMRLSKNYPVHNEVLNWNNEGTVNNSAVTIAGVTYPKRTLYMRKITWSVAYYGQCNSYFPHQFDIETYSDPQLVNEGFLTIDPDLGGAGPRLPENMQQLKDAEGNAPRGPLPLTDPAEPVSGSATPQLYYLDNGTAPGTIASASTTGRLQLVQETDWSVYAFPYIL